MSDICITVPLSFGLDTWIAEGDAAGSPSWSGNEWDFYLWKHDGPLPEIAPGERVYVTYNGAIRGYAPLVRINHETGQQNRYSLVRHGGAVAVTIPEYVRGFRGWKYRWWDTSIEVPFPDWQNPAAGLVKIPPVTKHEAMQAVKDWLRVYVHRGDGYDYLHRSSQGIWSGELKAQLGSGYMFGQGQFARVQGLKLNLDQVGVEMVHEVPCWFILSLKVIYDELLAEITPGLVQGTLFD